MGFQLRHNNILERSKTMKTDVPRDDQGLPGNQSNYGWSPPYLIALLIAAPLVFLQAGFNKNKAVDIYQQKYAQHFRCPYSRTGSCSETLRNEGAKALATKCWKAHHHD